MVRLTGGEFHHAARVARLRAGEEVELFDGRGRIALARVDAVERDYLDATVLGSVNEVRELPVQITVALALIQPERFELVLQKATELGASRFVPLVTDRIELRLERVLGKTSRWEKIIAEAAKQSGRATVPRLEETAKLAAVLGATSIFYDADSAERGEALEEAAGELTLVIGPEGGWSDAEIEAARNAGCSFRRLGSRRLRAETAAIAAMAEVSLCLERRHCGGQ